MLWPCLRRFNDALVSFQSNFPKGRWTPEFRSSLINDFSFYSSRIEDEQLEYGDTIRFLNGELTPITTSKYSCGLTEAPH